MVQDNTRKRHKGVPAAAWSRSNEDSTVPDADEEGDAQALKETVATRSNRVQIDSRITAILWNPHTMGPGTDTVAIRNLYAGTN